MSQVQETGKAPTNERPSQVHDTVPKVDPQEAAALEAIGKGLGLCGIEPDDWYWMANKILDVLKKSGILPFGVEDVIRKVLPNTQINRSLNVHVHERDLGDVTPDRVLKLTRALSDTYGVDWLLHHYRRNDPRRMPAFGALKATIGNTNVCVFFEETS